MTGNCTPANEQFYARKLYALLQEPANPEWTDAHLYQAIPELESYSDWWKAHGHTPQDIGSASDRVNFHALSLPSEVKICHPISGQSQTLETVELSPPNERIAAIHAARAAIAVEGDSAETLKRLFWWCWRFYPERREDRATAFLNPAHRILPDCPTPSYNSTVSALTGALFPPAWQATDEPQKPYLLLFTFSPVQEFIKASRKFADFWSGSYILHYLSARLCWVIAQQYGPDAVITPSLWHQEIIDALLIKQYPEFKAEWKEKLDPVAQFESFASHSLSTAGFPNAITALVPGKGSAIALGKTLKEELRKIWQEIAKQVRDDIKRTVRENLSGQNFERTWEKCEPLFPEAERDLYKKELQQLQQQGCWEWNKLWDAQIDNTWQPYFVAVPLGNPDCPSACENTEDNAWIDQQNAIALPRTCIPTPAEQAAYNQLNVGTWWGSLQARLGQSMQTIKNTRCWQMPTSPGERSSLSGQFSALHPRLHYHDRLRHGRGMSAGSMRLFWHVISLAYPGLFDGSERLNALELTKRMAWIYGGVAESCGIKTKKTIIRIKSHREQNPNLPWEQAERLLQERFSRFPNLSSIASARFVHDHSRMAREYLDCLKSAIESDESNISNRQRQLFGHSTQSCPSNLPKTDNQVNPRKWRKQYLNGVMFSSKWLAEDLNLPKEDAAFLKGAVDKAHKEIGFGDSSPADWWVLLLADGDSMGQYVSGRRLKSYESYLQKDLVDRAGVEDKTWQDFLATPKRMGPATHVGLNRALLDFSNRLVPHLTEHRFCGKVIYSGGDDVLVALPLADMPGYVKSLRAAWCSGEDPLKEFERKGDSGYWQPPKPAPDNLPNRPLFTMGEGATMSMGIIVAHKSVPLSTVLENLWEAEKEQAKKMLGGTTAEGEKPIPAKDGLCFRVVYGSGNTLEAMMKGHLIDPWWKIAEYHKYSNFDLSPVFNRLAEDLPKHAAVTEHHQLCKQAAEAILLRREDQLPEEVTDLILNWLSLWEQWAWAAKQTANPSEKAKGTEMTDLAALLKFTAFWISRRRQELEWVDALEDLNQPQTPLQTQEVSYVGV